MLEIMDLVFLFGAILLTSVLSALIGMGGGIALLSIMTFLVPWSLLIPLHGVVQLVSNGSRSFFLRAHFLKNYLGFFVLGVPLGAFLAFQVIKSIEEPKFFQAAIALLILYTLFKPKKLPAIQLPAVGFSALGAIAGFLSPLVGATGPFLAPFFLRPDWRKEQIIANKALMQFFVHLVKIPTFWALGFQYLEKAPELAGLALAAVVGTRLGVFLLGRLKEHWFQWLFKGAMFAASLRLLYLVLK